MSVRPISHFCRRARPMLGTLVEVGLPADGTPLALSAAFNAAFDAVARVQQALSRFDPGSDLSHWHGLSAGRSQPMRPATRRVLAAARALQNASQGVFDISLGSGPQAWRCQGGRLWCDSQGATLDTGGIAKGHAVDCAVRALRAAGCTAGWVNAGGDLRSFGPVAVPVLLRNEGQGGVRPWGELSDGALATSHFGADSRSALASGNAGQAACHVTVIAPRCLWADALTKVVAATGNPQHPLLARLHAQAFLH